MGHRSHKNYGIKTHLGKNLAAHRLAWQSVHGAIPNGMCICHHCDNPPCCNPAHLFLGAMADNMTDKVNKGRQAKGVSHSKAIANSVPFGEVHHAAVLTPEIVLKIRRIKREQTESLMSLAKRLGVSYSAVNQAANRLTWKHVK
jgi:hypothetical protein